MLLASAKGKRVGIVRFEDSSINRWRHIWFVRMFKKTLWWQGTCVTLGVTRLSAQVLPPQP